MYNTIAAIIPIKYPPIRGERSNMIAITRKVTAKGGKGINPIIVPIINITIAFGILTNNGISFAAKTSMAEIIPIPNPAKTDTIVVVPAVARKPLSTIKSPAEAINPRIMPPNILEKNDITTKVIITNMKLSIEYFNNSKKILKKASKHTFNAIK